jgi:hypothetical protein
MDETRSSLLSYAKATTLAHKPDCSGLRSNRQANIAKLAKSTLQSLFGLSAPKGFNTSAQWQY